MAKSLQVGNRVAGNWPPLFALQAELLQLGELDRSPARERPR